MDAPQMDRGAVGGGRLKWYWKPAVALEELRDVAE